MKFCIALVASKFCVGRTEPRSGTHIGSAVGKASRLKKLRRAKNVNFEKNFSESLTKNFQKELRNSEIWDQMVAEFGEEKAEQILKECKAEVKPGYDF